VDRVEEVVADEVVGEEPDPEAEHQGTPHLERLVEELADHPVCCG
jgi:hypothetical protein